MRLMLKSYKTCGCRKGYSASLGVPGSPRQPRWRRPWVRVTKIVKYERERQRLTQRIIRRVPKLLQNHTTTEHFDITEWAPLWAEGLWAFGPQGPTTPYLFPSLLPSCLRPWLTLSVCVRTQGRCVDRRCEAGSAFVEATGFCHDQFEAGFCPGGLPRSRTVGAIDDRGR